MAPRLCNSSQNFYKGLYNFYKVPHKYTSWTHLPFSRTAYWWHYSATHQHMSI